MVSWVAHSVSCESESDGGWREERRKETKEVNEKRGGKITKESRPTKYSTAENGGGGKDEAERGTGEMRNVWKRWKNPNIEVSKYQNL